MGDGGVKGIMISFEEEEGYFIFWCQDGCV